MPINILYCEDKELDSGSFKDFFEASGDYAVTVVEYGSDVLTELASSEYDIVVIDRQLMHDLKVGQIRSSEGVLVALDIRRTMPRYRKIPIVVFSVWNHKDDIDDSDELEYNRQGIYFQSKRPGLAALRDKIQELLLTRF
jgi:CheY-like chemotaxis protein